VAGETEEPLTVTPDMLAAAPDERIDFERGMSYRPPATLALMTALVAIYGWEVSSRSLASQAGIVDSGALVRSRVIEGEYWRMFSATLLHGSLDHLIGNCAALYILGMAGEHALGAWRVLLLYVASGLAGSRACLPDRDRR